MKKKLFLVILTLVTLVVGVQSLSAQEKSGGLGVYLNPSAYAILGSENYIRGFAGALDFRIDLFGIITPGLQALVEYDSYLQTGTIPLYLTLGWENFWIGAGQSTPTITPNLNGFSYHYADFPNTYLVGFAIPLVPIGEKSKIKLGAEITWTRMIADPTGYAAADQLAEIALFFTGLKFYAGITLQLGI